MRIGLCIQKGGSQNLGDYGRNTKTFHFSLFIASLGRRYDTENTPMASLPLQRTAKNRHAIRDRQRNASSWRRIPDDWPMHMHQRYDLFEALRPHLSSQFNFPCPRCPHRDGDPRQTPMLSNLSYREFPPQVSGGLQYPPTRLPGDPLGVQTLSNNLHIIGIRQPKSSSSPLCTEQAWWLRDK
jgi:hypothetical protein